MLFTHFELNKLDQLDSLRINFQNGSQESTLQSVKLLVEFASSIETVINKLAHQKFTTAILNNSPEANLHTPEDWKNQVTWEDILTNLPIKKGATV